VPSVSRHLIRLAALLATAALLAGAVAGCSTTQEKAEKQQARAQHILDARAQRQKQKHKSKQAKDQKGSQNQ
jgi:outer membrane lipoprotein-sorting protein